MNDQNFTEGPSTQTTVEKIIPTVFKVEGWDYRVKVIKQVIFGVILILLGSYVAYAGNLVIGGVLILISVLLFLSAWFYWWRSKSLVKGKFYVPPENKQTGSM